MTSHLVADWIRSCGGTSEVRPVSVSIGNETFIGAAYHQRENDRIYLLGEVPKPYIKRTCVFTIDDKEMYVACGYTPTMCRQAGIKCVTNQHHPFGPNFILMVWDHDTPIDDPLSKPYDRIPMTVQDDIRVQA